MVYQNILKGRFLARPNRFIAHVETEDGVQICHVKNTGRCRELLVPGGTVWLSGSGNPARKTRYDLIGVEKQTPRGILPINMDAQAPNQVFGEWAPRAGWALCPICSGRRRGMGLPALTFTGKNRGSVASGR